MGRKTMLKGYLERQKATPKASICDELGVRMCCLILSKQMTHQTDLNFAIEQHI